MTLLTSAECREIAERKMNDPGQPVDKRVPGRKEPVDATGGQPGDEHLKRDRHGPKLLSASGGARAALECSQPHTIRTSSSP